MSKKLKHAKLEDINSLLESQEKMVIGLRPGTEKKVLWSQGNGVKSKKSIVFIHGFLRPGLKLIQSSILLLMNLVQTSISQD